MPCRLFLSHAPEDAALRAELERRLEPLRREGLVDFWSAPAPGEDAGRRAAAELERADVVLLLMSPDYLASEVLVRTQLEPALHRAREGLARAVPIHLRSIDWARSPVAGRLPLPGEDAAVTSFGDRDQAWLLVEKGLREVIDAQRKAACSPSRLGPTEAVEPQASPAGAFFDLKRELDALLVREPSRQAIERLVEIVQAHASLLAYAFQRLNNPAWLAPLAERGFFRARSSDLQGAPAVQCLVRLAPDHPQLVVPLLLDVPLEGDRWVLHDLARAARSVPPEAAARLTRRIAEGLQTPELIAGSHDPLWDEVGKLLPYLAAQGLDRECLLLLQVLLSLREQEGWEPRPVLPESAYRGLVEDTVPGLLGPLGIKLLYFLIERLREAVAYGLRPPERLEPEDRSDDWRRTIEYSDQVRESLMPPDDPRELLCLALRDVGEELGRTEPARLPDLLAALLQERYRTFQRLALHLLVALPEAQPAWTERLLTDRALFLSATVYHEYWRLAASAFGRLSAKAQGTLLDWIAEDAQALDARRALRPDLPEEAIRTQAEQIELRRLHLLRAHLPATLRPRHDELLGRYGEPEHPDLLHWVTVRGPEHLQEEPATAADLASLSVAEVVELLRTWRPPEGGAPALFPPMRRTLARQLGEAVRAEPERFAKEATRFRGLPAVYLESLIFSLAVTHGGFSSWEPVLDLCAWTVGQGGTPAADEGGPAALAGEADDWRPARRCVNQLLRRGFEARPDGAFPAAVAPTLWSILSALADDPDPGPAEIPLHVIEQQAQQRIRPAAIENVISYARWLSIGNRQPPGVMRDLAGHAGELLAAHLDPKRDSSLAVRYVMGESLNLLLWLDREWTVEQIPRLFPAAPELAALRDAAWLGFVSEYTPADFELLRPEYERTVEAMRPGSSLAEPRAVELLGRHILALLLQDQLKLEADGLLRRFLDKISDEQRARLLIQAGRSLRREPPDLRLRTRLQEYWDWRFQHIQGRPAEHAHEIGAFGSWLAADLPPGWALSRLRDVLRLSDHVWNDHAVVAWLVRVAESYPSDVLACVENACAGASSVWQVGRWMPAARRVVEVLLRESDPTLLDRAERLIHLTGEKGSFALEDMLRAFPLARRWAALITDLSGWGARLRISLEAQGAAVLKIERSGRGYSLLVRLPEELREQYGLAEQIPMFVAHGEIRSAELVGVRQEVLRASDQGDGSLDADLLVVVGDHPALEPQVDRLGYWQQRVPWTITAGQTLAQQLAARMPKFDLFSTSAPLDTPRQLIGREREAAELRERLRQGECTGLFGLRKVGKTSLARVVGRQLDPCSFPDPRQPAVVDVEPLAIAIYAIIQGVTSISDVVARIIEATHRRLRDEPGLTMSARSGEETSVPALRRLLLDVLDQRSTPVCLILDECDYLFPARSPLPGLASLLGAISSLRESFGRVSLTLLGRDPSGIDAPELEGVPNPLRYWFKPLWLGALARSAADELLSRLCRRVGLRAGADTLREAYRWTGGHPFLHRQFGSVLWALARDRPRVEGPVQTDELLDPAIHLFREQRAAEMESWDAKLLLEQRFPYAASLLSALIQRDPARATEVVAIYDRQAESHQSERPSDRLRTLGLLYDEDGVPRLPEILRWYGARWSTA